MFATIPSFLSAQPPRARAAPRTPPPSYAPPSPTAAYSPPSSPTSYNFSPPSPTTTTMPSMSASTRPSLFSTPSSLFSIPVPRTPPSPSLFSSAHVPVPTSFSTAHFPANSPTRHATVLNWEDVLAPTSLLTDRVGLEPTSMALENARALLAQDTYLQQALASIEEQTLALLTTASRLGSVFIVTDKSLAYMEATCAIFFPRLAIFLLQANLFTSFTNRIQVLAPPHYLSSPQQIAHWKSTLFQSICIDQLQRDSLHAFSLINVSAAARDAHLCVGAAYRAAASLVVPKCVEVSSTLSLETFFAQLQTLNRYLDIAATHQTAFSTQL